uniref:Transmembrane protein n=1 Tax=Caenorhabditis tropicalis TaxID=1561998 RepID=A0A1I7U1S5_9PELO
MSEIGVHQSVAYLPTLDDDEGREPPVFVEITITPRVEVAPPKGCFGFVNGITLFHILSTATILFIIMVYYSQPNVISSAFFGLVPCFVTSSLALIRHNRILFIRAQLLEFACSLIAILLTIALKFEAEVNYGPAKYFIFGAIFCGIYRIIVGWKVANWMARF